MKKKIFMACAALVVSAAAVVGVKAYDHLQMTDLALANIEALSQREVNIGLIMDCKKTYENTTCYYICPNCKVTHWLALIKNEKGYKCKKESVYGTCLNTKPDGTKCNAKIIKGELVK